MFIHFLLICRMDQYNSKEVKESIFLAESRAQKEIRKIMSDAAVDLTDSNTHVQSNGVGTLIYQLVLSLAKLPRGCSFQENLPKTGNGFGQEKWQVFVLHQERKSIFTKVKPRKALWNQGGRQ